MKTIRIAKNELRTLFYSPIAWFLLVVFLFDYGLIYTTALNNTAMRQEVGGPLLKFMKNITQNILGANGGLFSQVLSRIFLYIPLLTMGLMSRETGSGTIKLLYSSPVKVRQIIFGKFLAMMLFSLLMVLVLSIFVVCGMYNIEHIDKGPLLTGLLGIYFLLCVYSAIGLFMSCLTTYQVVAAISTLVMLAFLNYVGTIWQDIDFVRDLTFFLSISGRAGHMMLGLLTTKDILYFVLIAGMFLALSIYKLQGERETRPAWIMSSRYAGIVLSTILLGYIFSRPMLVGYLDLTATKSQTLTTEGQEILGQMKDGPLEVTSYINLLDGLYMIGRPEDRNIDLQRWEPYQRFKSDIDFKYVYYYDSSSSKYMFVEGKSMQDIAEKYAKTYHTSLSRFKTPEEIHHEIDLGPEMNRYVIQLKYGGKSTFLRLYDDMIRYPGEPEILAAMKRLTTTPPKIAFVTGELERNVAQSGDRQYRILTNEKTFRKSLINQGFDVVTISLHDQDIPNDIAALVLADPKVRLDTIAQQRLDQYIAAGGNLLIAGEPGRQDVLNPLLKPLGVQLMDGVLVQQSTQNSPDLVQGQLAPDAIALSRQLQQDASDSLVVSLAGAVGLSYDSKGPFDIQPLVVTNGTSTWSKKKKFNPEMIDKIEAPFAGQGGGSSLSVAGPVPAGALERAAAGGFNGANGAANANKPVDVKKPGANIKQIPASEFKIVKSLSPSEAPGQAAGASVPESAGAAQQKSGATLAGAPTASPAIARTASTATLSAYGTTGDGEAAAPGAQKPHIIQMSPGQGRSLQQIIDSIKAANNGKMPMATATGTPVIVSGGSMLRPAAAGTAGHDSVRTSATAGLSAAPPGAGAPIPAVKMKRMIPANILALLHRKAPSSMPLKRMPVAQQSAAPQEEDKPEDLAYSAADGDIRGTIPVALKLTRNINGKQQRIIVVGDADFLSNAELNRRNIPTCNFSFATSVFGWFSYGKFPVDVVRPEPRDNRVSVSDKGITAMKVIFLGVLPGIALLLGTILLIRRKRK